MPHPTVMVCDMGSFVHIMVDGGPVAVCDDCCRDCNEEQLGFQFGSCVVCVQCAVGRMNNGELPTAISREGEKFKTFCDRLNAPLRAEMDRLHAESN